MAVIINFPKMEKALRKDKKNVKLFYEKGIVILKGVAFVFKQNVIFAVNLMDYFEVEKEIDGESDLLDIKKLLFFLEQKVFSKDYWEELTAISEMSLIEGNIHIKNPLYSKTLEYNVEDYDLRVVLNVLEELNGYDEIDAESVSFNFSDIQSIYSVYSAEFKNDIISFTPVEKGYVKFTFKNRKHFYGFIKNMEIVSNDPFKFEQMKSDLRDINTLKIDYPEKPKTMAPPPPKQINDD